MNPYFSFFSFLHTHTHTHTHAHTRTYTQAHSHTCRKKPTQNRTHPKENVLDGFCWDTHTDSRLVRILTIANRPHTPAICSRQREQSKESMERKSDTPLATRTGAGTQTTHGEKMGKEKRPSVQDCLDRTTFFSPLSGGENVHNTTLFTPLSGSKKF